MHVRLLDLDGSCALQTTLKKRFRPAVHEARAWGRRIRLGCGFGRFRAFERDLAAFEAEEPAGPAVTLFGSGDFHHVSLALLRRLPGPFNLLVLDKHPDWMRGVPLLHCGTWVHHAAHLPQVKTIFHVGGDLDFDNAFRWLAPWSLLHAGKLRVFPAVRRFERGAWRRVPHRPVRWRPDAPATAAEIADLVRPWRADLARWPLYVSLDKDVLVERDAVVNWDSGFLNLSEVAELVRAFVDAAGGRLAGADLLGDWSAVYVQGLMRHVLHWTEHPNLDVEELRAAMCNERANLTLLGALGLRPRVAAPHFAGMRNRVAGG